MKRCRLAMFAVAVASVSPAMTLAGTGDSDLGRCPQGADWERRMEVREQAREQALPPVHQVRFPAMQRALLAMMREDQHEREKGFGTNATREAEQALLDGDARRLSTLHGMLAGGFPTPRDVGYDGVSAAWLLLQHADADPGFQRRMLDQLLADPERYAVRSDELAMLVDRVLLHEGKPQRYGTQFEPAQDGSWRPRPIENATQLAALREQAGLMPMETYACLIAQMYGASASSDGAGVNR